jgi:hypothetical protein
MRGLSSRINTRSPPRDRATHSDVEEIDLVRLPVREGHFAARVMKPEPAYRDVTAGLGVVERSGSVTSWSAWGAHLQSHAGALHRHGGEGSKTPLPAGMPMLVKEAGKKRQCLGMSIDCLWFAYFFVGICLSQNRQTINIS